MKRLADEVKIDWGDSTFLAVDDVAKQLRLKVLMPMKSIDWGNYHSALPMKSLRLRPLTPDTAIKRHYKTWYGQ